MFMELLNVLLAVILFCMIMTVVYLQQSYIIFDNHIAKLNHFKVKTVLCKVKKENANYRIRNAGNDT